ncbi:MAG: c-type cytochrome [Planctomycetota bacterium]|nr:c-type cytochrome [Planctomycetota bacterium]
MNTPSPNKNALISKLIFGAIVIGILAYLVTREPNRDPVKDGPKDKKKKVIPRGSSKLWFGIRADKGPVDGVTQKSVGVTVLDVIEGSPASSAGLTPDDLILEFNGKKLSGPRELAKLMDAIGAGKPIKVKVKRADQLVFLNVRLESGGSQQILKNSVKLGAEFIAARQNEDGSFNHFHLTKERSPAVTALLTWALAVSVDQADQDSLARDALEAGIEKLRSWIDDDGGIDTSGWDIGHRSYGTACAILAFRAHDPLKNNEEIDQLTKFLLANQVDESHGYDPVDWRYGAFPYYESMESNQLRTDISTLSYVVQALDAAKVDPSHVVWRRIGLWLDETQNYALLGETEAIRKKERLYRDGGFAFSPRNSKVTSPPESVLNMSFYPSYGTATADGLRSLVIVDGSATHKRALAALQWLARNYGFGAVPSLPADGPTPWGEALFFYYTHSWARALTSAKVARIIKIDENKEEVAHHWPAELTRELARRQRKDGSWKNTSPLMGEDNPMIATAFALLALDATKEAMAMTDVVSIRALPVQSPPTWKDEVLEAPSQDPLLRGLQVYKAKACAACHKDGVAFKGPSLLGVADRFIKKFKTPADARSYMKKHIRNAKEYPGTTPFKGEEMFAYSESALSGPELEDLVTFLLTRKGKRPVSKALMPGQLEVLDSELGDKLFQKHNCVTCHKEDAHGPLLAGVGTRYIEAYGTANAAREALAKHIRNPEKYPSLRKARRSGPKMTTYTEANLSNEDLADIVAYLMKLPQ